MPSTMYSCFPKMKRPHSQDSSSSEDENHQIPILIRNYNSLYSTTTPLSPECQYGAATSTPDLSAVYTSSRFFISSPGQSNSIIDSLGTSASASASASSSSLETDTLVMKNSVAVPTYSPDPYADFRRSMEEMVAAREGVYSEMSNWEYLHELLLCYLSLNPKTTHKFIIGAFAGLVVDHMSVVPAAPRSVARHGKLNPKAYGEGKGCRLE